MEIRKLNLMVGDSGVDRREIAFKLGIAYQTLSHKLNGFCGITRDEVEKILKIINKNIDKNG